MPRGASHRGSSVQDDICTALTSCRSCSARSPSCVWCGSNSSCMASSHASCALRLSSCYIAGDGDTDHRGVPAPYLVLAGVCTCIACIVLFRIFTWYFKEPPRIVRRKPSPQKPLNMCELEALWPSLRPIILLGKTCCDSLSATSLLPLPVLFGGSKEDVVETSDDSCNGHCAVCLTSIDVGDECRELLCQHVFHKDCIDEWLIKSRECPMCRQDVEQLVKEAVSKGKSSISSWRETVAWEESPRRLGESAEPRFSTSSEISGSEISLEEPASEMLDPMQPTTRLEAIIVGSEGMLEEQSLEMTPSSQSRSDLEPTARVLEMTPSSQSRSDLEPTAHALETLHLPLPETPSQSGPNTPQTSPSSTPRGSTGQDNDWQDLEFALQAEHECTI